MSGPMRLLGALYRFAFRVLVPRYVGGPGENEACAVFEDILRDAKARRGSVGVLWAATREAGSLASLALTARWEGVFGSRSGDPSRGLVSTFAAELRSAYRALARTPGFSVVVVLTLAIGLGANASLFSIVDGVLLRSLPFPDSESLVSVGGVNRQTGVDLELSAPDLGDTHNRSVSLEAVAGYNVWDEIPYTDVDGVPRVGGRAAVTEGFFEILGVEPMVGRWFSEDNYRVSPNSLVLSYDFAVSRYSSADQAIGNAILIQAVSHTVVGVMPPSFTFPGTPHFWVPETSYNASSDEADDSDQADNAFGRENRWLTGIGRLSPGYALTDVRAELDVIASSLEEAYPRTNANYSLTAEPLFDALVRRVRSGLLLLTALVTAVLVLACTNVANLFLARGASRERDMAVRSALGAGRSRLVLRALAESSILAVAGGLLGILVAKITLSQLVAAIPTSIPRIDEVGLDGRVFAVMLLVSTVAGIVTGLIPALKGTRPDLKGALIEGPRAGTSRHRHRAQAVLVVSQVSISTALTVGAILITSSFYRLMTTDPGFQDDRVFTTYVAPPSDLMIVGGVPDMWMRSRPFFLEVVDRLEERAEIESVALHNSRIVAPDAGFRAWFHIEGTPEVDGGARPTVRMTSVSSGFFETLGIPLVAGRVFQRSDSKQGPGVAVVNNAFVERYFDGRSPIGERLTKPQFWAPEYPAIHEIVGVVADVKHDGLYADAGPALYVPFQQAPIGNMGVAVRTVPGASDIAAVIRETIWEIESDIPLEPIALRAEVGQTVAALRFTMFTVAALGVIGVVLAGLGLYGVLAYSVTLRRHEIGVRMAIGAHRTDVVSAVMFKALTITGVGVAIGLVAAGASTRLAGSLVTGLHTGGVLPYISAVLVFALVALLASGFPAWGAGKVQPQSVLNS
jgi:putative ABC transport system permease protein